ncbi:hypothetical protein HGI47_20135 [Novosphingobium sp. ERN07]|uniref:NAD(P)-dependent oxidoreductase n=1 Tax=Novosphingobium sp. ERN07 TaxID=2726187 RepID=UPI00145736C8|nr:NAD(P)-dependent oxidoreductase [Novosphingobium sp. ERN07]NLR73183.1 hypothetical protein [Novosphingobium sp. ERN07]
MTSPLRIVLPRDAWERLGPQIKAIGPVDPVLFERDGGMTYRGERVALEQAGFTAAWFSLDTFVLGQDEQFLEQMIAAPGLRWMQSARAGFDHPAFAALAANGVRLSMSKAPAPAIGEYVIAAAFDHFQRGPERRVAQAERRWQAFPFREIAGTQWVCVGYGEIGSEVAWRAAALGAAVTGVRRSAGNAEHATIVPPEAMGAALAGADVVVLSIPLSGDNDGAYGAQFFGSFMPGALFINVGRGQLLDEAALRTALDAGQVGHAVLDVTREEPPAAESWLWSHPRITLTAHTSGIGSGLAARSDALLLENLGRYMRGEPMLHEVSPEAFA